VQLEAIMRTDCTSSVRVPVALAPELEVLLLVPFTPVALPEPVLPAPVVPPPVEPAPVVPDPEPLVVPDPDPVVPDPDPLVPDVVLPDRLPLVDALSLKRPVIST